MRRQKSSGLTNIVNEARKSIPVHRGLNMIRFYLYLKDRGLIDFTYSLPARWAITVRPKHPLDFYRPFGQIYKSQSVFTRIKYWFRANELLDALDHGRIPTKF